MAAFSAGVGALSLIPSVFSPALAGAAAVGGIATLGLGIASEKLEPKNMLLNNHK